MSEPVADPNLRAIRKVFFLYPHAMIEKCYREIIRQGFDAFLIQDHAVIPPLASAYEKSILYLNIDRVLKDDEWLSFAGQLRNNPATAGTDIGVMTEARLNKKYLSRKYLIDIGISCGFISLMPQAEKVFPVILKILEANEARGRRRYVRTHCLKGDSVNFTYASAAVYGELVDISLAGVLFRLRRDAPKIPVSTALVDVQLKLQGAISPAGGIIRGLKRPPPDDLSYLLMFDPGDGNSKTRENILTYLCHRQEGIIREASWERVEVIPSSPRPDAGPTAFDGKPNEQVSREMLEELELVQSELNEINEMFGREDGKTALPSDENKFEIRS